MEEKITHPICKSFLPFIPPFFLKEKTPDVSPLPRSPCCAFARRRFHSPPHAPRPPKRTCRSWCSIMQRRAPASSWEIACRTKARRGGGAQSSDLRPLGLANLPHINFPGCRLFQRGLGPGGLGFESGLPLSNDQSLSFSGIQSESKPPNQTTNEPLGDCY